MRKNLSVLILVVLSIAGLATPASAQGPYEPNPDRAYILENFGIPGRCADIPGYGPGRVDGPVNQWRCTWPAEDNQKFYFVPRGRDADGRAVYWIRNATDGLCLDLPAFGAVRPATKVTQYHCRDNDNQYWYVQASFYRPHFYWWYWIREAKTGMCLDIPGVANAPLDVQLEVFPCRSNDDHEWGFRDWDSGRPAG